MNEEDRRISADELDAEPERFGAPPKSRPTAVEEEEEEERRELERIHSVDSDSIASSSEAVRSRDVNFSRVSTVYEAPFDLERHPTALSRIQTGRSQHDQTVGTSLKSRTVSRHSKKPLPSFGGGKPFPPQLPEREEDGPDDPMHAQNWPLKKKLVVAVTLGFITLTAAFGSSIFSAATGTVAKVFGVSSEVGILGVSLYVLGFATGPMLWAPFSELYGRKMPILISSFVATAKDLQTVFLCRFFSGFFGACPITIVGAVFADMFNNRQRGLAITVYAMTVFVRTFLRASAGPLLAPFIGGFIITSHLGWRWTEYITAIMGFLGLALALLFLEETYPPLILVNKAAELRRRTKNWGIHAKQEEIEIDVRELLEKNLSRPIRMLFTEPIVLSLSIYMAFIYGLLYLFLTFYPIIFQEIHGFSPGVGGLPFLGMIIGYIIAGTFIVLQQPGYNRKLAANDDIPIPEWRLPPVIAGGVSFAIGVFWLGWTGFRPDIPWIAPTLSGLATGFGIMCIFLQCLNYLIDAYLMFAASAIAANTFLRSLCGAGFPLFAKYMILGMGVQWAGTLLGCVAVCLVPLPVLFYLRGAKIRAKSKFAPTFPIANRAAAEAKDFDEEKTQ